LSNIAFITGYARSGTTMLATMLSRHPKICTMGETHFFITTNLFPIAKKTQSWWNRFLDNDRRFGILEHRLVNPGDENVKLTRKEYFDLYSADYCKKKIAEWYVDKSPSHLDVIPSIYKEYPNAPIINLVRDVRDTTASMLKAPWAHNSPLKHMIEWRVSQQRIQKFSEVYGIPILNVRYEDLLAEPEIVLTRILKYIDGSLEYSEALLSDSTATDAIPHFEREWKEKAAEKPDASRLYAWKRKPESWCSYAFLCNNELSRLGYELQEPIKIGLIEKVKVFIYSTSIYRNFRVFIKVRSIYDK
jgi:hypothetical protein